MGDRSETLAKLREQANLRHLQYREELVHAFESDPVIVHLHEHYDRALPAIL